MAKKKSSDPEAYAAAAAKVAKEKRTPRIDLHRRSIELLNQLGPRKSEKFNPKSTASGEKRRVDRTHLLPEGAEVFGRIVAEELKKVEPSLTPCFK